jgi:hypothetical protein
MHGGAGDSGSYPAINAEHSRRVGDDMKSLKIFLCVAVAMLVNALPAMAQQKRISPHETISTRIDGQLVMIVYGRPYTKDPKTGDMRKIWGTLIPYGKIWRTGSDEATLLITQKPLLFGDTTVPAGAYTLWTLPNEDGSAKLIINKQIGQWGINPRDPKSVYDEANDVVRIDLKKDTLDKSVDEFTMAVGRNPTGGGLITMSWENTQYSVGFTIPK